MDKVVGSTKFHFSLFFLNRGHFEKEMAFPEGGAIKLFYHNKISRVVVS
jgi:hypothetical protein